MLEENYEQENSEPEAVSPRFRVWVVVALVVAACLGVFGYAVHERGQVATVTAQNQKVSAALADTNTQIEVLTRKLNELTAAEQARQQAQAQAQAVASRRNTRATVQRRRAEDTRWKKVQSELEAHQAAIDATRNDLSTAKTELNGSIARTHDELVVLQRKGERNYYEFDIDKNKKRFVNAGPVAIQLRKADTKKQFADLHLNVDDNELEKKHVNLYEPVTFLNTDSGQPVQLVINRITKNHIHGYVAEPKYRAAELASTAANPTSAANPGASESAAQATPPAAQRKRLPVPR